MRAYTMEEVAVIVDQYGDEAVRSRFVVECEHIDGTITEDLYNTAEAARSAAMIGWDHLTREEKRDSTIRASEFEFAVYDGIAVIEPTRTIWSSVFEGRILKGCRDATSAIVHVIRGGVETSVAWGEGSDCRMPDLEHFLTLVRSTADEHPEGVSVEFFEDREDAEGNYDFISLGYYEVD